MNDPGVEYRLYLDQFRQDVAELKGLMTGAGDQVEQKVNDLDSVLKKVGIGMVSYFTFDQIREITAEIKTLTSDFEKYEAVLTNSLGSHDRAVAAMDKLQEFAAKTPFQLNNLTDSFVKMVGQGFQPTMEEMTNLGDLASSKAKDFDQLAEALLDAEMGENERLKEFGIKAQKNGDIIKYTFKGVTTEVDNNAQAIRNYILGLGKMEGVAGSMAAISKTLGGAMSNAKDSTDALYVAIGSRLSPSLTGLYGDYSKLIGRVAEWIKLSPADKLRDEREEVNMLAIQLQNANISEETRATLLARLNELAPDVAAAIDTEKGKLNQLSTALETYNKNMALKILMAEKDAAIEKQKSGRGGVESYMKLAAEAEANLVKEMNNSLEWFKEKGPEYVDEVKSILIDSNLDTVKKAEKIDSLAGRVRSIGITSLFMALDSYKKFKAAYYEENRTLKQMIADAEALVNQYKEILGVKDETEPPGGGGGGGTEDPDPSKAFDKWKKNLLAQKEAYKEYEAVKSQISQDEADKLYSELLKKAGTYAELLKKLLAGKLTKDQIGFAALELQSVTKKDDTKATKEEDKEAKKQRDYLNKLFADTKNHYQKLNALTEKYLKDKQLLQERGLTGHIEVLDEQYRAAVFALQKENGLYSWLFKNIENYSRKELKDFIARVQKELEIAGMPEEKKIELQKKLAEANEKLDQKLASNLSDASAILGDMAAMAGTFNEKLAESINTAADLAAGASNIAAGLASENYAQVVGGILQTFTSIIKLFGSLSTLEEKRAEAERIRAFNEEKYTRQLQLQNDFLERQIDLIKQLNGLKANELTQKTLDEIIAEREALLNKTYWLPVTDESGNLFNLSTSGIEEAYEYMKRLTEQGYSVQQDVWDMINQDMESFIGLNATYQQLLDEWNERVTGTTAASLGDKIAQIWLDAQLAGDDFIKRFGEGLNDVMREALVAQFKDRFIMEQAAQWYESLAEASRDADGLTAEERTALNQQWLAMIAEMDEQWKTMVENFPDLFSPSALAGTDSQSTAGAIKNIQEGTANILAGHTGAMRVDLAKLVISASQHLDVLNKMDKKLGNIEKYTKETRDVLQNSSF